MYQEHREVVSSAEAAERIAACLLDTTRNTAELMRHAPEVEPELHAAAQALAHVARQMIRVLETLTGDRAGSGEIH